MSKSRTASFRPTVDTLESRNMLAWGFASLTVDHAETEVQHLTPGSTAVVTPLTLSADGGNVDIRKLHVGLTEDSTIDSIDQAFESIALAVDVDGNGQFTDDEITDLVDVRRGKRRIRLRPDESIEVLDGQTIDAALIAQTTDSEGEQSVGLEVIHVQATKEFQPRSRRRFTRPLTPWNVPLRDIRISGDAVTHVFAELEPELRVAEKNIGAYQRTVENAQNLTGSRVEYHAAGKPLVVTSLTYDGSGLINAHDFTLWADLELEDGIVDTIIDYVPFSLNDTVRFNDIAGGGVLARTGEQLITEVHFNVHGPITDPRIVKMSLTNVEAELLENGSNLPPENIRLYANPTPLEYYVEPQGSLFISKDTTPVRQHQYVSGTLGDTALRLNFQNDGVEPIDVTMIPLFIIGDAHLIDHFKLYRPGDVNPFAIATKGACGAEGGASLFCAHMENSQFIVDGNVDVLVRPVLKRDESGGGYGSITVTLGVSGVRARGIISANDLAVNDGDTEAEGEIFIGNIVAGPSQPIIGVEHQVVGAAITRIEDASTYTEGGSVPVGYTRAAFEIFAAAHNNSKGELDVAIVNNWIIQLDATNVLVDDTVRFMNEEDRTRFVEAIWFDEDGNVIVDEGPKTGILYVGVTGLPYGVIDTIIEQGSSETLEWEFQIIDPKVDPNLESHWQVTALGFNNPNSTAFAVDSYFEWVARDQTHQGFYRWIDFPENEVRTPLLTL